MKSASSTVKVIIWESVCERSHSYNFCPTPGELSLFKTTLQLEPITEALRAFSRTENRKIETENSTGMYWKKNK